MKARTDTRPAIPSGTFYCDEDGRPVFDNYLRASEIAATEAARHDAAPRTTVDPC